MPSLEQEGRVQLYPKDEISKYNHSELTKRKKTRSHYPHSRIIMILSYIDTKLELKKLNKSLLFKFLELLDYLIVNPFQVWEIDKSIKEITRIRWTGMINNNYERKESSAILFLINWSSCLYYKLYPYLLVEGKGGWYRVALDQHPSSPQLIQVYNDATLLIVLIAATTIYAHALSDLPQR